MGVILVSYGDDAGDHEGYAAQVLDDGSLTGVYSDDTRARMVGRVVAACDCGWTGSTRYPTRDPFDEAAHALALAEWEHSHARPTLDRLRALHWDRLGGMVRQLAQSHVTTTRTRFTDLPPEAQRDLLDRTLTALHRATELVLHLRGSLDTGPASGGDR
ncbi:MAG: hypothetical protein ACRDRW_15780 [Pseudonocardiaceae bacterium]